MMLLKFRQSYPQGSLVSELIDIDRGIYIFKASIKVDDVILATAHAGGNTIEAAEDSAIERVLTKLLLDHQSTPDNAVPDSSRAITVAKVAAPNLSQGPVTIPESFSPSHKSETTENNSSSVRETSKSYSSPTTIQTNPLNKTANLANDLGTGNVSKPLESSQPNSESNLFGDTATAELPISPLPTSPPVVQPDTQAVAKATENRQMDFNEIKQKTDIEIRRLSWTKEQGKDFLMSHYGKRSRLHLTDEQLLEFLTYLEQQPSPVA